MKTAPEVYLTHMIQDLLLFQKKGISQRPLIYFILYGINKCSLFILLINIYIL